MGFFSWKTQDTDRNKCSYHHNKLKSLLKQFNSDMKEFEPLFKLFKIKTKGNTNDR